MTVKTVTKNKTIKSVTAPRRGRPKKQKSPPEYPIKKRRGRPPKKKEVTQPAQSKKRRGRPPKRKEVTPVVRAVKPCKVKGKECIQEAVKGPQNIIEDHPFYAGALWIQQNITPVEEAYLKRTANRHNTTVLYSILEHMLGYFSIHNSALGAALKEVKNPHTNN
jgi:hypothetical protein